jgi:outer membrane protein OmpA-like peptidoglycan-associated protein
MGPALSRAPLTASGIPRLMTLCFEVPMKQLLALALIVLLSGCVAHAHLGSAERRSGPFERVTLAWNDPPAPDAPGRAEPSAKPWMSLTASDGSGLEMVSYRAKAVVDGPLAFTELHLEFHNRKERTIEGTFQVTLPPTASVSRFAMKIGGSFQEGEVVELDTARRTYESFMHRRVDPALLEQSRGNEFRARVFPIGANEVKELVLSYTEELASERVPYQIRLRGLPHLDALDVEVLLPSSRRAVEVSKRHFMPDRDFVLASGGTEEGGGIAVRRGRLAVARVTPLAASKPEPIASVLILFDTSASQASGQGREIERLGALVEALRRSAGSALSIRVACFDQEVAEIYDGPAAGFGPAHLARIAARGALGASDIEGALRWASQRAPGRVLLVTDGVATAGSPDPGALLGEITRLSAAARVDAVIAGSVRDPAFLERIVSAPEGRRGIVADSSAPPVEIAGRLTHTARSVSVRVPGSLWSSPTELSAVEPGDQVLVYAELPEATPLTVDTGAGPAPVPTIDAPAPLLERALARVRIAELLRLRDGLRDEDERSALRQKVVLLSTQNRVLTPFTGFLVLETEADYARFGLDRRALHDILTVGAEGVELIKHPDPIDGLGRDGSPRGTPMAPSPRGGTGDRDGDGIPDQLDKCPDLPEDFDGIQDADGCPEDDADKDGIPDAQDACPREPGEPDPDPRKNGCPKFVRRISGSTEIQILRTIEFDTGRASITPRSFRILDEVVRLLQVNPDIKTLAVEGHTDNRGSRAASVLLSEARAKAVGAYLIKHGVAAERLVFKGHGPDRPIADNNTFDGRQRNRRVEFHILEQRSDPWGGRDPVRPWKPSHPRSTAAPHQGRLFAVLSLLGEKKREAALREARAWYGESSGDTLAPIALGAALDAAGQPGEAARAYGSLIDLHPSIAGMRRHAGALLESLSPRQPGALSLALQSYRSALAQRPDHPSSHRRLGYALLRAGEPEQAFEVFSAALRTPFPPGRFPAIHTILIDDLGIAAAAWTRAAPDRSARIAARARDQGATVPDTPSVRASLSWETDASDLDLHILDANGGEASRFHGLSAGGNLYADVTDGYGPEVFVVAGEAQAFTYRVKVESYRQGPTGHAFGSVDIVRHDGRGGLTFDTRPFVIMTEGASVDLGTIEGGKRD